MEYKCQQCPYLGHYVQCTRTCHERQNRAGKQKRQILVKTIRPAPGIILEKITVIEDYRVPRQ